MKTPFFSINRSANRIQAHLKLDASMPCFDGHFPNSPILPGIAHIHLVCKLIEHHLGCPIAITSLGRVKFTSPCAPEMIIIIGIDFTSDQEASFWVNSGLKPASRGTIRFTHIGISP